MKRVLITGITSLHGWPLYQTLTQYLGTEAVLGLCPPKTKTVLFPHPNVIPCCMSNGDGLHRIVDEFQPTHVIHAAGICDLDVCELWPSLAYQRNVEGTEHIAALCQDCHVMYISTDLVFSGNTPPRGGYPPEAQPDPISMIGKTFVQAECIVAQLRRYTIVRKGLPMGPSISRRKGPIDYLSYRFRRNKPLTLFDDELRSALYSTDFVQAIIKLWELEPHGYYHLGGPQKVSLYAIGKYLIDTHHFNPACLIRASRRDDPSGLPRIGDVALNSQRTYARLHYVPRAWP